MKLKMYYFRLNLIVAFCALLLISCNTGLTREKARELIEKTPEFAIGQTEEFYYGYVNYFGSSPDIPVVGSRYGLASGGLIEFKYIQVIQGFTPVVQCSIQFTQAGLKYTVGQGQDGSGAYYNVLVARKQLVDITGIEELPGGNQVYVTYTWKYVDQTPFGAASDVASSNFSFTDGRIYVWPRELFTKYDDGWRIGG